MTREEINSLAMAMLAYLEGRAIQWETSADPWTDFTVGEPNFTGTGIRWRPKPEPKRRPWRGPEDVPLPVCWLRIGDGSTDLITSVSPNGVKFTWMNCEHKNEVRFVQWNDLTRMHYSTDGKTWLPCEVTE